MARARTNVKRTTTDGSRTATAHRLPAAELRKLDAYWRACNYLAAGMIYLRANPLLREPLKPEHVKRRLLGHWGAIELHLCSPQSSD
jgi:xylulose-5-phosphate/fructose-6-phosphate phosphoketolase